MNHNILSKYQEVDTPALLINKDILLKNIQDMQDRCDRLGVLLRPHIKTHKSPDIAKMQLAAGAAGITVAKLGEAEVMAESGISDIFIANQVVGAQKIKRLIDLSRKVKLIFGVDSVENIQEIDRAFGDAGLRANVLIEVDTGELRCGITSKERMEQLVDALAKTKHIDVLGVFTHEGFVYKAKSMEHCLEQFVTVQEEVLEYAKMAENLYKGTPIVSVGATPTAWLAESILPGVTEIRPGTYALMDVGQANAINNYDRCAASVLVTVLSKPTHERIICDVGAKGITAQTRTEGICKTQGYGRIKNTDAHGSGVYDEHMIINNEDISKLLKVGDKIEIIPNHICPVCNLYENIVLVSNGAVDSIIPVTCRSKMQ